MCEQKNIVFIFGLFPPPEAERIYSAAAQAGLCVRKYRPHETIILGKPYTIGNDFNGILVPVNSSSDVNTFRETIKT